MNKSGAQSMRRGVRPPAYGVLLLLLSLIVVTACAAELSGAYNETAVKQAARDIIQTIHGQDSANLQSACTSSMQTALTEDALNDIYEAIEKSGAFKEITSTTVVETANGDIGYATVVVVAEYENTTLTYTLSLTENMELAGLYYK